MHARGRAQLRAGRNRPQQADLASDQHGRLRGQHARLAGCDRAWPGHDAGHDVGASVRSATMGSRRGGGSARSSACVTHSKNKSVSLGQQCRGAADAKEKGGVSSSPDALVYLVCTRNIIAWRSVAIRPCEAVRFTWPFWLPEAFWSVVRRRWLSALNPLRDAGTVGDGALHTVAVVASKLARPCFEARTAHHHRQGRARRSGRTVVQSGVPNATLWPRRETRRVETRVTRLERVRTGRTFSTEIF